MAVRSAELSLRQRIVPREGGLPVAAGLAVAGAVAAVVVAARLAGAGENPRAQEFVLVLVSIVVEALPFILIGAIVSGALASGVGAERAFLRLAALRAGLQVPGAGPSPGVCFPVCECGSVPVAKRLLTRGIDPAAGVTFMLAAPVLNPIVLSSTWIAYGARGRGGARDDGEHGGRPGPRGGRGPGYSPAHRQAGWSAPGPTPAPGTVTSTARITDTRGRGLGLCRPREQGRDFVFMGRFLVLEDAVLRAWCRRCLPQRGGWRASEARRCSRSSHT